MDGLKIICYYDCGECAYREGDVCAKYDCFCEDVHVNMWKEDGKE